MAVRIAFSDGTFVSKPGLPSVVTKPNPVDNAVPVVLPYCGMLVTVVADGTDSEEPPPEPHGEPASTTLPLASHLAQLLLTPAAVALAYFVPLPVEMLVVTADAGRRAADSVPLEMLLAFVASVVAEGESPVTPLAGTEVATMVPVLVAERDAPAPMTMAAEVLVPLLKELKALLPPLPEPHGAPASMILPLASHLTQSLLTPGERTLANLTPVPEPLPVVKTD